MQVHGSASRYGRGLLPSLRSVFHQEGIRGLYGGLGPSLLGSGASWGGYFYLYEKIKAWAELRTGSRAGPVTHFCAAAAAGAGMVAMTNPIWLVKTRMQLQVSASAGGGAWGRVAPYKGAANAVATIVAQEGIAALYKGAVPALLLTSHGGVQFVAYEYLKGCVALAPPGGEDRKRRLANGRSVAGRARDSFGYLCMGAVSKIIASTVTYPLQVIKSRLQQRAETAELTPAGRALVLRREYSGLADCAARTWQEGGVRGFFRGAVPNALRVAPGAAVTFFVYENTMDYLEAGVHVA